MSTSPVPGLTPAELDHFNSLSLLFDTLNAACRDPQTPVDLREQLEPVLIAVSDEMDNMNALALNRNTVDLQADAEELQPAVESVNQLKDQLDGYAQKTQLVLDVLARADAVLSTAKQLGITV